MYTLLQLSYSNIYVTMIKYLNYYNFVRKFYNNLGSSRKLENSILYNSCIVFTLPNYVSFRK